MIDIIWSVDAEYDYEENIEYLLKKWTFEDAEEFVSKVENVIKTLKSGTASFQTANYRGTYKCVICKQITLYYRKVNDTEIELIRFWNNYKDDKSLKL